MELTVWVEYAHAPASRPSEVDVLVRCEAPAAEDPGQRPPLNLSLVLDQSGSMAGAKLDAVTTAARRLVDQLRPTDRLSVVSYDSDVHLLVPQGPPDRELLRRRLDEIVTGSSTNLSGGWLEGLSQLDEGAEGLPEGALHRVLLLTDGQANEGVVDGVHLARIAEQYRARGRTTTTLGFGDDFDAAALQGIADQGGGRFYHVRDADGVSAAFLEEFGELSTLVGQNLEVRVSAAPGVRISEWLTAFPGQRSEGAVRARLGDVYTADRRDVLFTLALPAGLPPGACEVAWIDARYVDVRSAIAPVRARTAVGVEIDDARAQDQQPEPRVRRAALLARCAQGKQRAAQLFEEGQASAARALLDGAIAALDAALDEGSGVDAALGAERASLMRYRAAISGGRGRSRAATAHAEAYEQREGRAEHRGPRPRTLTCELCPRTPERLLDLLSQAVDALRELGHDEALTRRVRFVLDELVGNALEHGARGVEQPTTRVELRVAAGYALVRVTDNGQGFAPGTTMGANRSAEQIGTLGARGRGLISVERGVDALSFNERGNQVTALIRPSGAGATRRSGTSSARLSVDHLGDVTVIDVAGHLDAHTHGKLTRELERCFAVGQVRIVCDLRHLQYVNSAGAGALIRGRRRAAAAGGDLVLARVHPNVLEVLDLLGLTRLVRILDTLDAAVKAFGW